MARRSEVNPAAIRRYAKCLLDLPPIEINQHNQLIDGWYRLEAHKLAGVATIRAVVTEVENELHHLELFCMRNSRHGLAYTDKDEQRYQDCRPAQLESDIEAVRERASCDALFEHLGGLGDDEKSLCGQLAIFLAKVGVGPLPDNGSWVVVGVARSPQDHVIDIVVEIAPAPGGWVYLTVLHHDLLTAAPRPMKPGALEVVLEAKGLRLSQFDWRVGEPDDCDTGLRGILFATRGGAPQAAAAS